MAAQGREVAIRLRASGAPGRHGARPPETESRIERCHFIPRTSSETDEVDANTVIVGLTLIAPGGTDLRPDDRVRRALDGQVYEIEGEPGEYRKRGRPVAVIAALRRVTG